jgi:hypothetical protein
VTLRFTIELPSAQALLLTTVFEKTRLGPATGFVVPSKVGPLLITCRHVVTGRDNNTGTPLSASSSIPDSLIVRHNGAETDARGVDTTVETVEPLYEDGQPRWIEHPTLANRADLVALRLTQLSTTRIHMISLVEPEDRIVLRPAEPVSVVGFPFGRSGPGQFAIWATGFVASEPSIPYDGLPVLLIDCRTRPGQSGSPVIAHRIGYGLFETEGDTALRKSDGSLTQFVGAYSGRIHPESDIGMVWKASAVRDLVSHVESIAPAI